MRIGFIGQGYVGKSYADNFTSRGFETVRYSLEPEYRSNKLSLKSCAIVFISVPTPTTPTGHDFSIVNEALGMLSPGTTAVIKSTIIPGTTKILQAKYKKIIVLHSPEFLTAATARRDVDHPLRNIIGMPGDLATHRESASRVLKILPKAQFELICDSTESEFIKYAGNTFYYTKVVYMNILHDLAQKLKVDWSHVKSALAADPWIGPMHIEPIHKSGRGAGGHCLIKDYAALRRFHKKSLPGASLDQALISVIEKKNIDLLISTNKDLEILKGVYGRIPKKRTRRVR